MAAPCMKVAFRPVFRLSAARFCRNFVLVKVATSQRRVLDKTPASIRDRRCFSASEIAKTEARLCWQCAKGIMAEQLTCPGCGRVQKVLGNANYFRVLGIDQRFAISAPELADKFKALQSVLHPDRFATKSEREQEYSAECSSLVNMAYKTLLRPLERAAYLLRLAGQEEVGGEAGPEMDAGFLSEVMDVNEVLAETRPSDGQLRQMGDENEQRTRSALERLTGALDDGQWTEAKTLLAQLRYYENIEKKIKDMELERTAGDAAG